MRAPANAVRSTRLHTKLAQVTSNASVRYYCLERKRECLPCVGTLVS